MSEDHESTTAALARVTQERDYLLGVVEGMRRTIAELIAERDEMTRKWHAALEDGDQLTVRLIAAERHRSTRR